VQVWSTPLRPFSKCRLPAITQWQMISPHSTSKEEKLTHAEIK
jgi:hypothetical protein